MHIVYPMRGAFWEQDRWGRLLNAAVSRSQLNLSWSTLAERACDLAHARFESTLHSVYLSGPAARNRPGGASIVIVLKPAASDEDARSWAKLTAIDLQNEAPFRQAVNVTVLRWRDIFMQRGRHSPARFRLAVNSICIGGRNLHSLLPAPSLNEAVSNSLIVSLESRLKKAKSKTMTSIAGSRIRKLSTQVGHDVVSAGYATVMASEQTYTEDLDLRRDIFAMHYPELKDEVQRAYDMAALPTSESVPLRAFINEATEWILPTVTSWLNTYNPERDEMLVRR